MMRGLFLGMSVEFFEINGLGIRRIVKFPGPELQITQPGKVPCVVVNMYPNGIGMAGNLFEFFTSRPKEYDSVC